MPRAAAWPHCWPTTLSSTKPRQRATGVSCHCCAPPGQVHRYRSPRYERLTANPDRLETPTTGEGGTKRQSVNPSTLSSSAGSGWLVAGLRWVELAGHRQTTNPESLQQLYND
jgi:hypothetical protein